MDLWKLLTSALAIAVGLLLYERYFKPAGITSNTKNSGGETTQQMVEKLLNEEGL